MFIPRKVAGTQRIYDQMFEELAGILKGLIFTL